MIIEAVVKIRPGVYNIASKTIFVGDLLEEKINSIDEHQINFFLWNLTYKTLKIIRIENQ